MEFFVLLTPSMVINYQNSHVSPFEGRGFRALGPIKKGDIYLKVRNVQILIFRDPFWLVMFLNLAGSLYHMLVSGQSKGCLQGRCFSLPQKLTDEHKQYVHCILVRNASPPFTILTKSKSQLDNSQIVKTLRLKPFLVSFPTFQIDKKNRQSIRVCFFFCIIFWMFSIKSIHQELQQLSGEGKTLASLNEDLMALHLLLERSKGDAGGWNRWNTNFFWVGRCRFSLFTWLVVSPRTLGKWSNLTCAYFSMKPPPSHSRKIDINVLNQVDFGFIFYSCHVGWSSTTNCHLFFAHHISLAFSVHHDWRKMCGSKRCPHILPLDTQQYV